MNFGPRVVTDNLIFAVDAANPSSYVSGSTIWKDQTVNQNNGTLTDGPTFDSSDGGSIVFDGVDDYIDCGDNDNLTFGDGSTDSPFSISAWIKWNGNKLTILSKYGTNAEYWMGTGSSSPNLLFIQIYGGGSTSNKRNKYISLTGYENQWIHLVGAYNGQGGSQAQNGLRIYLNGVRQAETKTHSTPYTAMSNTNESLKIGKLASNYADGKISNIQIYNKELSPSEVLQNYNALKGRFE